MASVATGQIYLMSLVGDMDGQECINTFTYRATDASDPTKTVQEVAIGLNAALSIPDGGGKRFDSTYLALLPSQYVWVETWIQVVSPTRYVKSVFAGGGAGTSNIDGHWANSAAVITRRGEEANRKNIGSVHICFPSEAAAVAGKVPAGYKTDMGDFATQMRATQALAGLSVNMVPVLFHKGGTPNYSVIKSTIAQDTVRVMRRRTVGVGS